jgi:hypothetical protein
LDKNNTTGSSYNISSSLTSAVQAVYVGYHVNKPIPNTVYPVIFIEPRDKVENFEQLGNTARRTIDVYCDIVAITNYGMAISRETSDNEMLQLSANIETLLRNYPRLSQTAVMMSNIDGTDYDVVESNDTWNSIARIKLAANIIST